MQTTKSYWSRSGIICGIVFAMISVLLSTVAYNDPAIRHPEGFSDFKSLAYPNVLLGFPAILVSRPIISIVSSFYKMQTYSSIPNDDLNNQNITEANAKTIADRYQTNLRIQFFVILSIYWFFIGAFIAWIYNRLSKKPRIFFVAILMLLVFGVLYISLVTFYPRHFNPQAEVDKVMQGQNSR